MRLGETPSGKYIRRAAGGENGWRGWSSIMDIIPCEMEPLFHRVNNDNARFVVLVGAYLGGKALKCKQPSRSSCGWAVALNPCDPVSLQVAWELNCNTSN